MPTYEMYNEETAPAASKPLLEGAKKSMGMIPNLFAGMAESPVMLESYTTLAGIFNKSDLTETEKQVILMTISNLNGCDYCMAAHTTISQGAKVPADVLESLRSGSALADSKLEALRKFTITLNEKRGWVDDADIDPLISAGFTKKTVFEVIVGTSLKVMSNYVNHVVKTPLDAAFSANKWTKA